jgi:outer membrane protein
MTDSGVVRSSVPDSMRLLIGLLLALAIMSSGLCAEELMLDQALRLALAANRSVLNARIEPLKLGEQRAALRARRFPVMNVYALGAQTLNPLDFTLSAGLLGIYPATGPIPATDVHLHTGYVFSGFYAVKAVQPLSSLYRIRQNVRLLDISAEIAKDQVRQQEQEIVRNVKKLYYTLQQAESSLRAIAETTALYREISRQTEEYLAKQAVLKADQLSVQLNLAKAEQSEHMLRNQEITAKEQLNELLGRDVLTEFTVPLLLEINDFEMDYEGARKAAIANRPEVLQAHLKVKLAEQDILVKKAEYIPEFSAEFDSYGLANFNHFLPVALNSVGVSLNWDVFDWGRKKHELAEKRFVATQARNAAAESESAAVVEVDDKLRQLQASKDQVRVARLAREVAAENLRMVKVRFQIEAVLVKDVLQAQAALEQANAEQAQALVAFWSAKADFERAIGATQ